MNNYALYSSSFFLFITQCLYSFLPPAHYCMVPVQPSARSINLCSVLWKYFNTSTSFTSYSDNPFEFAGRVVNLLAWWWPSWHGWHTNLNLPWVQRGMPRRLPAMRPMQRLENADHHWYSEQFPSLSAEMVICEAEVPCFSGTYKSHGVRQFLDGSDAASCNLQQEVQLCGPPLLLAAFGELYHQ